MTAAKKLYEITADYRDDNPNKPTYYAWGDCVREAKDRFRQVISWLNIYGVRPLPEKIALNILSEPAKHIII